MRRQFLALLTGALVLALSVGAGFSVAAGAASGGKGKADEAPGHAHSLDGPLSEKRRELRQQAMEMKLAGKVQPGQKVVKLAPGQFVELTREDTDKVFVVIAEFGTTRHSAFPDNCSYCTAQTYEGPAHNAIPQPDRSVDNTTLWQADYDKAHYEDMYFNRMAEYYESQSSGRYSVDGDVTEWVKVPFNEARYGRSGDVGNVDPAVCSGIVCNNTWFLIRDAMAYWVKAQLDAGQTMAQIQNYLKTFDEWDRYDLNGNGNFDEPDGFIDHFQIVHAGGDEAAGDPFQGNDAIWSHRWYAQVVGGGPGGLPGVNAGMGGVSSGVTIPNNPTGVWVGDYTIQPENGGLGVFAHEYGHDLDLPDLYDTSGNTGGAENSTGFWTLMSSGANIGDGGPAGIGDAPTDLGAWEKFMLGWMDAQGGKGPFYEVAQHGKKSEHKIGPANTSTKQAQAVFVVLPDKQVPFQIGPPYEGSRYYYSGQGDSLDHFMTKSVSVPAGGTLAAKVRYDIETDWDYAYVVVSTNGGSSWTPVATNLSTNTNPNGQNFGNGITGSSGGNWVDLTASLAAYGGQTVQLGFRYWTDIAVAEPGISIDNIQISGLPLDGAEAAAGWTFTPANGFRATTGTETQSFFNAYVLENRGYRGYDTSLKTAYNFGFLNSKPDWVEHFRYQDGLLISYWNTQYATAGNPIRGENNVGDHPGEGMLLPVDAHPDFFHNADGTLMRARILSFDSTFGLDATDPITINNNSVPVTIPSRPAVPVFDDTKDWWFNADQHAATGAHVGRHQPGWIGVKVPKTGTTVRVKSISQQGNFMQVEVAPKK
jgi:immune inhibitor A